MFVIAESLFDLEKVRYMYLVCFFFIAETLSNMISLYEHTQCSTAGVWYPAIVFLPL